MISIRLKGRLGNQLFIYCVARAISVKYNQDVTIIHNSESKFPCSLYGYCLNDRIKIIDEKKPVKGSLYKKFYFVFDRLVSMRFSPRKLHEFQLRNMERNLKHGFFFFNDGYYPLPEKVIDNTFFDGYFQCDKFFDFIKDDLIQELIPIEEHTLSEKEIMYQIDNSESVCLTIRLGDFLNNPTHEVCTIDYFIQAMERMVELVPNCKFFVFSDDINMVKKIFNFKRPVVFDDGKSKDYMSLDVMSHCKHFIISNSSFSWWAQYLSNYNEKIVISPSRWYAQDIPCDIMQDNWIKIDC